MFTCPHARELPILEKANDSRCRAWRELRLIRQMLGLIVEKMPPVSKPANFEEEGKILRAALARAIAEPWEQLTEVEKALEDVKPYITNILDDGRNAVVTQRLRSVVNRERPAKEKLAEMRGMVR